MDFIITDSWSRASLLCFVIVCLCIRDTLQGQHEERLITDIFFRRNYNPLARPVEFESDALEVKFGVTLQQIVTVDEKNEMLHTNMWLNYEWHDYKLGWNESEYGGVASIRLPSVKIWTPDILMYNSADEDIDSKYPTNIVVYSDGKCTWVPLGLYISSCSIDIRWFPFDDQHCSMKFGSWTYDGNSINLTTLRDTIDTSTYQPSGEWILLAVPAVRSVGYYVCCPEPYIDITFYIHIRRRALYYGINLIIPCAMISALALLIFTLPPDSGEKIGLTVPAVRSVGYYLCCPEPYIDITFFIHIRRRSLYYLLNLIIPCAMISALALLIFALPPDAGEKISLKVPAIRSVGYYVCCPEPYIDITFYIHIRRRSLYYGMNLIIPCAMISALALLIFTLPPDAGEKIGLDAPAVRSVNTYACCAEPYIDITFHLHIRRRTLYYGINLMIPCTLISFLALQTFNLPPDAGEKISLSITILLSLSVFSLIVAEMVPSTSLAVPLIATYFVTMMIMCTISVLMTVLVLNFHHRSPDMYDMPAWVRKIICEWLAWILRMQRPGKDLSRQFLLRKARMRELEAKSPPSMSLISNVKDVDNAIPLNDYPPLRNSMRMEDHSYNTVRSELLSILNELRFITHKIKEDNEGTEEANDWKFAAMVIDRLCFITFSLYMIVATLAIFFSAPHILGSVEGITGDK